MHVDSEPDAWTQNLNTSDKMNTDGAHIVAQSKIKSQVQALSVRNSMQRSVQPVHTWQLNHLCVPECARLHIRTELS